jgi:nucleoside 2-deoxyribosyltransferase
MKEIVDKLLSKTPLVFLLLGTVVLLVAASGTLPLGYATVAVDGTTWRALLGTVGVGLLGLGVYSALREKKPKKVKHDLFFSYPMAAWGDGDKFKKERTTALEIIEALRTYSGAKDVYFAGRQIASTTSFQSTDVAAEVDLKAIDEARYFVMVLPEKMSSSVIFEAGYALAKKKPGVYFVNDLEHLPFLMKNIEALPRDQFPRHKIYTFKNQADLLSLIENIKEHLLPS